ncbi:MAG: PAS domain S-box protein, partial [Promethearchaeota archaeon]
MKNPEYNKEEIRSKYRDLFQHSLDYIYVNDLKGNFLDANNITLKALDYEVHEIPSLSFLDVLADEEQLITAMETTKEIIEKGRQQKISRYKLKGKNGNIIYLETYGIPLKKDNKIYAILGIGRDITLRKSTEHKLKESEKRFRNLFEMNPYGIVIFDLNGKIIDSNPTTEILTGYKKESLIGKHFNEIMAIKQKDL